MSVNSDKAIPKNLKARLDPEQIFDILDLFGVCLFMTDLEGHYTFANQSYLKAIGVDSCSNLLGKTVFDLYDEPIASQYHAEEQSILRDGTADIGIDGLRHEFSGDRQITLKGRNQLLDEQGNVIGLVGFFHDITDRVDQAKALELSEGRNRALLQAIPYATLLVDIDGVYLDADFPPTFQRTDTTNPVGQNRRDILPIAEADRYEQLARKAIETGTVQESEYTIEVDGVLRTREVFQVAVNETTISGIIRDITEQRQRDDALQLSEARNCAMLEAIPDAIVLTDDNGKYLYTKFPPDFQRDQGRAPIVGLSRLDVHSAATAKHLEKLAQIAVETGTVQTSEHTIELDGVLRTREVRIAAVNETETLSIVRDITEQRTIEDALQQSLARDEAMLAAIPDIILIIAKDGSVEEHRAPRQNGTHKNNIVNDLVGINLLDIVSSTIKPELGNYLKLEPTDAAFTIREIALPTPGGSELHEIYIAQINEDNFLAIVHNINSWKEAEKENSQLVSALHKQRIQLRAMNQRVAEVQENERRIISQELHDTTAQDLAALGVNLDIIQSQLSAGAPVPESALLRLQDSKFLIKQSINQVRNLLSDLHLPELADFGLLSALKRHINKFNKRVNLQVTIDAKSAIPRMASNVETALFRITQEALANVEKHAKATTVKITLQKIIDTIHLTVVDDGKGFDRDAAPINLNRQNWGLLIMQERAEAVGIHLKIDSTVGEGTTVTIEVEA